MPRFIRSACLTDYVPVARSFGLDPYRLLKEAGLDRSCLIDPEIKIPVGEVCRLLENSARAARSEDFGLRMSEPRRLSDLGPLALAMRDAGTLREALQSAMPLRVPAHRQRPLVPKGDGQPGAAGDRAIGRGNPPVAAGHGAGGRCFSPRYPATARQLREQLAGLVSAQPPQMNISRHYRVFGPQVEFGHSATGLLFARRDLDRPLPGADPVMARHVKRYLDPMLARSHGTVSDRVRQLVYEQLSTGRCAAEQAANSLGMDRRTLHRHLGRFGETFSSIVDEVRSDLAPRYLEERRRSLNEVAFLLGFSAPSAFSRWFRGRFGCTPRAWRIPDHNRTGPK